MQLRKSVSLLFDFRDFLCWHGSVLVPLSVSDRVVSYWPYSIALLCTDESDARTNDKSDARTDDESDARTNDETTEVDFDLGFSYL